MEAAGGLERFVREKTGVSGAPVIGDLSSLPTWVWQDLPVAERHAQVGLEEGSRVLESSTGSQGPLRAGLRT